jgi:two-component system chemotaxis response regulator CheB
MVTKRELLQKHERRFPAGTVIYREGSIGEEMYVVRSGSVELSRKSPNGSTRLAIVRAGEFFGETEGLGHGPHSSSARVLEEATLLAINLETLTTLVSGSSEIATRIIKQLAERSVDDHARIGAMAERGVHGRILSALAALAEETSDARSVAVSNERLARAASIDDSTLLNALDRLTSEGLIRRVGADQIWIAPGARIDAYLNSPAESARTRVLIVDDSPLFRRAIEQALSDDPLLEVVGTAENGRRGVELVASLQPDVITMDVQMPDMSGLEAIPEIMARFPTPILVLTSLADIDDGSIAFEALRSGALDLWPKPTSLPQKPEDSRALAAQLHRLARIKVSARARASEGAIDRRDTADLFPILPPAGAAARRIAIVADTGGPATIAALLARLPTPFPAQLLLFQRLESANVEHFAGWLGRTSKLPVRVAGKSDAYEEGVVLLVPPEGHDGHVPADRLLESMAEDAVNSVAVVLSGAGREGVAGLRCLVEAGGLGLVLHPGDAVVDELPRAAMAEAPACRIVSGAELPELLGRIVGVSARSH